MDDNITPKKLTLMTKAQLIQLAKDVFNEDVEQSLSKADMVQAILGMDGQAEPVVSAEKEEVKEDKEAPQKRYKLTLNSNSDAGGDAPLPVQVNQYCRTIPRDIEVEVPEEVITVLNLAVVTLMEEKGQDKDGRPIYKERDVKQHSFSYREI